MCEILAIIPARSGSKSVPNKNIREICGKPMLAYSIEHALSSKYINRVILSTDSLEYKKIGLKYGAEVPFLRPFEYATDDATDFDVFNHALSYLKEKEGYIPDIVVQLRPTYPIRNVVDIDNMIKILINNLDIDSVKEITDSINIKKIYTERNNLLSKNIFKDKFFDDEDILIIDGNQVFDIAILSRLNRYKHDNVLVVKKKINPDNTDHIIQLEGNRVKAITSPNLMSFPWISFCGIARFSSKTVKELSEIVIAPMPLLEALKGIINNVELI